MNERTFYRTYKEASQAAKLLKITSGIDYKRRYTSDPFLPSNPSKIYASEWSGWSVFLRKDSFYLNWQEASIAAKQLGFISGAEYKKGYKEILDYLQHHHSSMVFCGLDGMFFLGKRRRTSTKT